MAINLGGGSFSVPTMPNDVIENVSEGVSGVQEYVMNLVSDLPSWAPMAAVAALLLGPFGLIAAYVVLAMGNSGGGGAVAGRLMS